VKLYFLLFLAFLVQEQITSNTLVLAAYQSHYNVWIIHALFLSASILDAVVFWWLGRLVHDRYENSRLVRWTKKEAQALMRLVGKNGELAALFFIGSVNFPLVSFVAPWLEFSFWDSFAILVLGDIVFWYGGLWLVVLGTKRFIPNPHLAILGVILVTATIVLAGRIISNRVKKRRARRAAEAESIPPPPGGGQA
jgi:membrane protein YqaA with SNARE-associated domain